MSGKVQGTVVKPAYIYKNGDIRLVSPPPPIQIDSETELESEKVQALPPTSIAKLAGWSKAWQKKNDGTWAPMIGGE